MYIDYKGLVICDSSVTWNVLFLLWPLPVLKMFFLFPDSADFDGFIRLDPPLNGLKGVKPWMGLKLYLGIFIFG